RKPKTLVLQLFGQLVSGSHGEAAIFSDQPIALDTPYYVAAAFRRASDDHEGTVTFYLKDLSNDDEPLQVAEVSHQLAGGFQTQTPMRLGEVAGQTETRFDGLIDDVRLTARPLAVEDLLYTSEKPVEGAIGYWQFESEPGLLKNSLDPGLHWNQATTETQDSSPDFEALVDWCHLLFNSNEFLYRP
ncbi:MAG: hypothetical protein AAFV88_22400, partial [Planctomycetota bacterium]